MSRTERFWSLNIGICDLFVIWCLEFVILNTKLQGKAASYKITLVILYIDIDWNKKPEARTYKINPKFLRAYL